MGLGTSEKEKKKALFGFAVGLTYHFTPQTGESSVEFL